jgi:hypothetical protein
MELTDLLRRSNRKHRSRLVLPTKIQRKNLGKATGDGHAHFAFQPEMQPFAAVAAFILADLPVAHLSAVPRFANRSAG